MVGGGHGRVVAEAGSTTHGPPCRYPAGRDGAHLSALRAANAHAALWQTAHEPKSHNLRGTSPAPALPREADRSCIPSGHH